MALTFELYTGNKNGVPTPSQKPNTAYLKAADWDDFNYKTLFAFVVFDENGVRHDIGSVKIGRTSQKTGWSSNLLSKRFKSLDESFFSLGQSEEYYSIIQSLEPELRRNILESLKDVVYSEQQQSLATREEVFKISLLRDVSLTSVYGQYKRILQGGAIRTEFHFKYRLPQSSRTAGMTLEFHVDHESNPPSNVHVLIGRNGVGKTHLLNNMVETLITDDVRLKSLGEFSSSLNEYGNPLLFSENESLFSGVVSVAFSAFDPFDPHPEKKDKSTGVRYSYVGLKRVTNRGGERGTPMSRDMLTNEFVSSTLSSFGKGKSERWLEAVKTLESDPLFKELALSTELTKISGDELEKFIRKMFSRMSSGHAIVLLTISKLVEKVEEKTLVLLDEPEAHLHPPLLSAFVRALSDLLAHRNGVAIVATHSPVILQEVPSSCVYKISRSGLKAKAERPLIETFGENVGVLTREIFGLEVSDSGYHQLLRRELTQTNSYDRVMRNFDGQLGSEAKGLLRSLILALKNEDNQ